MSSVPWQVLWGRETEDALLLYKGENKRAPQLWESKTGFSSLVLRELSIQVQENIGQGSQLRAKGLQCTNHAAQHEGRKKKGWLLTALLPCDLSSYRLSSSG